MLYALIVLTFYFITDFRKLEFRILDNTRNAGRYVNRYAMGFAPFDKIKFQESTEYLKRVPRLFPEFGISYGVLGYAYYHLGEMDKAIESYEKAAGHHSNYFGFQYNLGILYFKSGRFEEAAQALTAALEMDPKHSIAHHSRVGKGIFKKAEFREPWITKNVQQIKIAYANATKLLRICQGILYTDHEVDQERLDSVDVKLYYYVPLYETGIVPLSRINKNNIHSFK